jgi:transcriptional regulator GlxA family with amidase domain
MDTPATDPQPFRIGYLLIDGFALMSYAAASEPIRAANLLAGRQLYQQINIAISGDQACSSSGAAISADAIIGETANLDLLLVVAGGDPASFSDRQTSQWLRGLSRRGLQLGGVSGGPVILAMAGLMDNRRMTVHWEHANALSERYPDLLLERTLYVVDRDRITCAGGAAPLDMMLAMINDHHGPRFARQVADWFMHTEIRSPAGPQRAGLAERYQTNNATVLRIIEIMQNNLADPLPLAKLANFVSCSPRHLNRLFRHHMKQSTMAVYRQIRLERSCGLLIQSSMTITQVALAAGFQSSAHFASSFLVAMNKSPSQYRQDAINR